MSAQSYNLPSFRQGTDFTLKLTYKDSSGNPINITGYRFGMRLQPGPDSRGMQIAHIDLTTQNGGITLDPTNGIINILLPGAQTANISWVTGNYNLIMKTSTGQVQELIFGTVTVIPSLSPTPS